MKYGISTLVLTTALLWTSASYASYFGPEPYAIDEDAPVDTSDLPESPHIELDHITRGIGFQPCPPPREMDDCVVTGSLDGLGVISFTLSPNQEDIGYIIEVVSGSPPPSLRPLDAPVSPKNKRLWVLWEDGATHEQEPLELELRITPLDRAGRMGEPSNILVISDPGRSPAPTEPETSGEDDVSMSDEDVMTDEDDAENTPEEEQASACSSSPRTRPTYSLALIGLCLLGVARRERIRCNRRAS